MYGFLIYVVTTVIMVFAYPTPATPTPAVLPALWYIGALMVCLGGYWFWFFIRVDVAAEGNSPFRMVHADLFIVSLLASVTLGLIWAFAADCRQHHLGERVPGSVPPRHDGVIWINSLVQVLSYVLQARSSLPEASGTGERLEEEPACARRTPRNLSAAIADNRKIISIAQYRCSCRRQGNAMPTFVYMTSCDGCGHCVDICPSDIMHIDTDLSSCLQHRAQHVLGVLLVREGVSAECDRLPRLRGLRPLGPQRSGSQGRRRREPFRGRSNSGTAAKRISFPRSGPRRGDRSSHRLITSRPPRMR